MILSRSLHSSVARRALRLSGYVLSLLVNCLPAPSQAQITLDGTLGPKGNLQGPDYTIDAKVGRQVGSNLFHSFGDFNVHTGESATFTGPATVENVIGRVTGGHVSDIDGTIRSEMPDANVYLLNPAGVMFGPNATLDVPGSFHVSTADYLKLSDGGRFAATQPETSVLTSAPPAAFGFLGPNPAPITIQGSTLEVAEGETLSVIGGDITMEGGTLTAPGGRLRLVSAASAGEAVPHASIPESDFTIESFNRLGNITISQGAQIDASGEGGGRVFLRAGHLEVDNGHIAANTQGNQSGEPVGIDLGLREEMVVTNDSSITAHVESGGDGGDIQITAQRVESKNSQFAINTASGSMGNGGNIKVTAGQLMVADGAQILDSTAGEGHAGGINITATDSITLRGPPESTEIFTVLRNQTFSHGGAGRIEVSAPVIYMENAAIRASAESKSTGSAGVVQVDAGQLTFSGGDITSSSAGKGNAGIITIDAASSITMRDSTEFRSGLSSNTFSSGDAGRIVISSPTITLEDALIRAQTFPGSTGKGGDIQVNVGRLILSGSQISSTTTGAGNGGTVAVTATDAITMEGLTILGNPGGLFSNTFSRGNAGRVIVRAPVVNMDDDVISARSVANSTGKGGDIEMDVGQLTLSGGAQIFSDTRGAGNGGTVTVTAKDAITIQGQDKDGFSSGLFTDTRTSAPGGEIKVID